MPDGPVAPLIFEPEYYARMRQLEANSWWNSAMREVMAAMLHDHRLASSGRMLDIGCGSGQTMSWFQETHGGWTAAGIDISPDAVQAAHQAGLTVALGSATELPFPDESAELIVSLDVLQHLPLDGGDRLALAEFRRALVPGGLLFLRTNAQAFPRTVDDPIHNFHKYQPGELKTKLTDSGFQVLRLGRINALLGLAEIARELRATRHQGDGYHGILAEPPAHRGAGWRAKHRWLRLEGTLLRRGFRLPLGRTILALARKA